MAVESKGEAGHMTQEENSLTLKASLLRQMRKEAKINQADLANMIGLCRETIINIEKGAPGAINSMSLDKTQKWFNACMGDAKLSTRTAFQGYIAGLFNM